MDSGGMQFSYNPNQPPGTVLGGLQMQMCLSCVLGLPLVHVQVADP